MISSDSCYCSFRQKYYVLKNMRSNSNGNPNCSSINIEKNAKRKYSLTSASSNNSERRFSHNDNQLEQDPERSSPNITSRNSSIFTTKHDKENAKLVNSTTSQQPRPPETPSPKNATKKKEKKPVAIPSKSRQKKFHRHFPHVDDNELVLNYYSCALIADILLQGHLYITKNYFAFYSNVFGYVTKLLIPTTSVLKISKEKTGRIFPNAVGIATEDQKHVFGSLLSRESTYNFLLGVWNSILDQSEEEQLSSILPSSDKDLPNDLDVSEASVEDNESSSHTDNEVTITANLDGPIFKRQVLPKCDIDASNKLANGNPSTEVPIIFKNRICNSVTEFSQLPRFNQLLLASVVILLGLFISAGVLLHRIDTLHQKNNHSYQNRLDTLTKGDLVFEELLKWQMQLHDKSTKEMNTILQSNLEQIVKIRQSLHILSLLLAQNPKFTDESKYTDGLGKS